MPWCLPHTYRARVCLHHSGRGGKKKRPIIHSIPATSYVTGIIGWGWQSHILGSCGHQLPWLPITFFQRALTQTVCVLPQLGSCLSDKDEEKNKKKHNSPFIYRVYIDPLQPRRQKTKEQRQLFLWSESVMLQMLEWHGVTKHVWLHLCCLSFTPAPSQTAKDGYFLLSVWVEGTIHCYSQEWNITGVYISEDDHLDTTKAGYATFEAMLAVIHSFNVKAQQHK